MAKSFKTAKTIKLFLDECREYLDTLDQDLVALERGDADQETVKRIKRNVHTLKGSSAMLEFNDISSTAHAIEDVIARLEPNLPAVEPGLVDRIFASVDRIKGLVGKIESGGAESEEHPPPQAEKPAEKEREKETAPPPAPAPQPPRDEKAPPDAAPLQPERTNLLSIAGNAVRASLDRCFTIFDEVESRFVLADGLAPSDEVLDSLDDAVRYLNSTLTAAGIPSIEKVLYRLAVIVSSVREGKIPRTPDLIDLAYTGISHVKTIVENRIARKPLPADPDISQWQEKAAAKWNHLRGDKDFLSDEASVEIFQRLTVDPRVAALMDPFEKFMIPHSLIEGYDIYQVSMRVPAERREAFAGFSEVGKAFFEKGKIPCAVYRLETDAPAPEFSVVMFYATNADASEVERLCGMFEGAEGVAAAPVNLVSERPAPPPKAAAEAEP
ncbi:MAG: Hpt domain-containing protein, partial [bacterium]